MSVDILSSQNGTAMDGRETSEDDSFTDDSYDTSEDEHGDWEESAIPGFSCNYFIFLLTEGLDNASGSSSRMFTQLFCFH